MKIEINKDYAEYYGTITPLGVIWLDSMKLQNLNLYYCQRDRKGCDHSGRLVQRDAMRIINDLLKQNGHRFVTLSGKE